MPNLYHVTLSQNIESILERGIEPRIGALSKSLTPEGCQLETIPRVYLFPDIDNMVTAIYNWLGEKISDVYGEDCECSVIEINSENLNIVSGDAGFEVYVYSTIPPSNIINVYPECALDELMNAANEVCSSSGH